MPPLNPVPLPAEDDLEDLLEPVPHTSAEGRRSQVAGRRVDPPPTGGSGGANQHTFDTTFCVFVQYIELHIQPRCRKKSGEKRKKKV